MTTTLTDRLERLADRGPHADAGLVVARATAIAAGMEWGSSPARHRPHWQPLLASAAVGTVLVGGLLVIARSPDQSSVPARGADDGPATAPSAAAAPEPAAVEPVEPIERVEPTETLPARPDVTGEVPPTVVGTAPTDWYRLQPDLEVAWFSPNDGTSMLCLRTPTVPEICQPDEFLPTEFGGGPIGVDTAGGQLIVLTLDPGDTITLATTAGAEVAAPVRHEPGTGWGVARFHAVDGVDVEGLAAMFSAPADDATPSTAPASVPDSSVPGPAGTD